MTVEFAPLTPELYVTDLHKSLAFYTLLGFRVAYARLEEGFAFLSLGGAHLMLEETPLLEPASPAEFEGGAWRTGRLAYPFRRGVNFEISTRAEIPLTESEV